MTKGNSQNDSGQSEDEKQTMPADALGELGQFLGKTTPQEAAIISEALTGDVTAAATMVTNIDLSDRKVLTAQDLFDILEPLHSATDYMYSPLE